MNPTQKLHPIEDCPQILSRFEALWQQAVIDRPVTVLRGRNPAVQLPEQNLRRSWNNVEQVIDWNRGFVDQFIYYADALPVTIPNIGPDFFAGCYFPDSIRFEKTTSYITPRLSDYDELSTLRFDWQSPYLRAIDAQFDALTEVFRDRAFVMFPDLHFNGDALAGMRGPEQLCLDLFDRPEAVRQALAQLHGDAMKVFDYYVAKSFSANQPLCNTTGMFSNRQWHSSAIDFSYLISPESFCENFLPVLQQEASHAGLTLHHLDGSGCARHIDTLLSEIPEIKIIQWVFGAGGGQASDYLPLYQKIQRSGCTVIVYARLYEVDTIIENLKPEGVFFEVLDMVSPEEAEAVIKKVSRWK